MGSSLIRQFVPGILLLLSADPASAQYRRQVEELPPVFGVNASLGALLSWDETITPVVTPDPDAPERRGLRSVGTVPAVSVGARYGRGIAVYGSATVGLGAEAELSGADPISGLPIEGTDDVGLVTLVSVGASFVPVRNLMGLRLDLGPAWADLGNGGSYLGLRIAAAARFIEVGDRMGVFLAWDGYFVGGQDDRDGIEYQVRGGIISGVRLGLELVY